MANSATAFEDYRNQGSGTFFAWRATFTIFFFFISEEPQKDGYKKKFGYLTNSYFYSTEFS